MFYNSSIEGYSTSAGSPQKRLGLSKPDHCSRVRIPTKISFETFVSLYERADQAGAKRLIKVAGTKAKTFCRESQNWWNFLIIVALDIRGPNDFIINPWTENYFHREKDHWPYETDTDLVQAAREEIVCVATNTHYLTNQGDRMEGLSQLCNFWGSGPQHLTGVDTAAVQKVLEQAWLNRHHLGYKAYYYAAFAYADWWSPFDIMQVDTYQMLCDLVFQLNHQAPTSLREIRCHAWLNNPPLDLSVVAGLAWTLRDTHPKAETLIHELCRAWRRNPDKIRGDAGLRTNEEYRDAARRT